MRTIALYNRTWPTECQRLELLHFTTVHYYRMPKMRAMDIYNRLYCRLIVPLCFIRCIVARSLFYYIRLHLVSQSDCCFIFCSVCSALYSDGYVVCSLCLIISEFSWAMSHWMRGLLFKMRSPFRARHIDSRIACLLTICWLDSWHDLTMRGVIRC